MTGTRGQLLLAPCLILARTQDLTNVQFPMPNSQPIRIIAKSLPLFG